MKVAMKGKALVTGISGFVGSQVGKLLLEKGYVVRGTVRSKSNEVKMRPLKALPYQERLEIVEADLLKRDTWDAAMEGCQMVAHVASPFPLKIPKDENEIIVPAVEGTMSVLEACAKQKEVKSVVLTSSICAIQNLTKNAKCEYTEKDWPEPSSLPPYQKSKYMSEQAAWKFYESLNKAERFKLSVINPGLILGPSLVSTDFTSGDAIRQMMMGEIPAIPKVMFGIVDVRNVAEAHVAALESEKSDGQRYLCVADEHLWMEEIAKILRDKFENYGYKIPKRKLPYCAVKLLSYFDPTVKAVLPYWRKNHHFVNKKIKEELGINFIPPKEAIIQMGKSLMKHGKIPDLMTIKQ